jgi:hypothetical protein
MTPNNASESSANEFTDTAAPAGLPIAGAERAVPYLARVLQLHLLADPDSPYWITEGTAVFADISGFTQLSEQLARKGREGAEQITDTIGGSFASILKVAYENGASLLKFGGDALLLWFDGEGHAGRACRAAVMMRQVLHDVGRIELPDAKVTLQMSQGVHSGQFHFFAVGTSHLELLPRARVEPHGRDGTRGRSRRDPRQRRNRRVPPERIAWPCQGGGRPAAPRAARPRRQASLHPAAEDGA